MLKLCNISEYFIKCKAGFKSISGLLTQVQICGVMGSVRSNIMHTESVYNGNIASSLLSLILGQQTVGVKY